VAEASPGWLLIEKVGGTTMALGTVTATGAAALYATNVVGNAYKTLIVIGVIGAAVGLLLFLVGAVGQFVQSRHVGSAPLPTLVKPGDESMTDAPKFNIVNNYGQVAETINNNFAPAKNVRLTRQYAVNEKRSDDTYVSGWSVVIDGNDRMRALRVEANIPEATDLSIVPDGAGAIAVIDGGIAPDGSVFQAISGPARFMGVQVTTKTPITSPPQFVVSWPPDD
jgi:hypothetical protein